MTSTLREALREHFTAQVRVRGREYQDREFVEHLESNGCGVDARVRGTRTYSVSIMWLVLDLKPVCMFHCNCFAFERVGPCKHLWATILEADDSGIGPVGWAEGKVPLLEVEPPAASATDPPEASDTPVHGNWQRRARQLTHPNAETQSRWGRSAATRELRYVITSIGGWEGTSLTLQVRTHSQKKDGAWGAGKAFRVADRDWGDLGTGPDGKILEAIFDACGSNNGIDRSGRYSRFDRGSYELRVSLYSWLLPKMVSTGRLYVRSSHGEVLGPVGKDDPAPWQFRPQLQKEVAQSRMRLSGHFVRGEESMPVEEPALVLAHGLLLSSDRLMRYEPELALHTINALRADGDLLAPLDAEAALVQVLLEMPGFSSDSYPSIELVEGVVGLFHLSVKPRALYASGRSMLDCTVTVNYGSKDMDVFSPEAFIAAGSEGQYIRRDLRLESSALTLFLESRGQRAQVFNGPDQAKVAVQDLDEVVTRLLAAGWSVTAEGQVWRTSRGSSFSVKSGVDWFDLEGGVEFGGDQHLDIAEMLEAARNGSKTVQLGDGSVGVLPERWLESWGLLDLAGTPKGTALRFDKNQGWLLDALLAQRDEVSVDQSFADHRKSLASFSGVRPKKATRGFCGELRQYQEQGLGWFGFLRQMGFGGCLADDMGLGKTVQVLALLESRRIARRRKGGTNLPSLVVAPRSVVFNWLREASRFAPKLKLMDYTGTDRRERLTGEWAKEVDLVVTTYGTLRLDIQELRALEFDYVILDEAQAIKNSSSQVAKAARLLTSRHRLALSGTPIENHLGELWSLFEFLNPGILGASAAFKRFSSAATDQDAVELARLSKAVSPFFLRRTKQEVLPELPQKTEQTLYCELTGKGESEYASLRDFYRKSLTATEEKVGLPKMKIQVLEALLRLRQAACHPGLIDKDRVGEDSAKLEVLLPMLEAIEAEGHKALVFSQFTSLLAIVRKKVEERGMVYEYLDGRTRKREEKVDRFQNDPDCTLFLISIKAGGSGLNLTAADYVFLLDPWWNPAVEAQAIDRVHRIGRTKPVIAYRLITRDTVEEKVVALQEQKRELSDAILGSGSVGLRDLTREDLHALLE